VNKNSMEHFQMLTHQRLIDVRLTRRGGARAGCVAPSARRSR